MNIKAHNLSKYQLLKCIARGGQGEVWKGFDTQLKRYVAIKLLHPSMQQDANFITRFEQEARLVASLRHPNIVKIHDFKIDHHISSPESGTPLCYMVMDYVEGETLADYIHNTSHRRKFPPAVDIVYIFTVVSLALDCAHQYGMIHRDIKPANILLDKRIPTARSMGEPILTDFGIARQRGTTTGTLTGSIVGTPKYMAPEQAQGQYDDPRSDLYSLGIILYEVITGETPFNADIPMAIMMQHLREEPKPPQSINPHVSPALSEVILKSIAKDPNARFPTAAALALALTQAFNIPASEHLVDSSKDTLPGASSLALSLTSPPSHGTQTPCIGLPLNLETSPYIAPSQPNTIHAVSDEVKQSGNAKNNKQIRLMGLTALLILMLLGSGLIARMLLFPPSLTETVIGHVSFLKYASSPNYNAVQIDMAHMPELSEGMAYYGWITLINGEDGENTISPHWKLTVSNQAIHTLPLTFAGFDNLYIPHSLFLITKAATDSALVVPDTNPATRLYYARINATTLDLKQCPVGDRANTCF